MKKNDNKEWTTIQYLGVLLLFLGMFLFAPIIVFVVAPIVLIYKLITRDM